MRESIILNLKSIYKEMTKKKKNAMCFLLVIAMLMPTFTVFAQDESKVTFHNGEFIGITSQGMERMLYSDDETPVFQNTSITIDYLDVHEDVDISGAISTADGDIDFHFTGDLYVSEKQTQGIEAYVGQIVDCENNFVVNYFEIKNDTSYDLLKYSEENLNKRIISFDLERNGIKYYFELDMNTLGVSFNAESITESAPSEIDFYENYVNEDKSVAPCIIDSEKNQIVEPRSTHSYSVEGVGWYTKEVVESWFSETIYEYYAKPEMEVEIVDVWTASSSNWTSKLVFGGYVEKDGVRIDTVDNVFSIQAGTDKNDGSAGDRIEFRMYTGKNTVFTSGNFGGACKINSSESNNQTKFDLIIGLLSAVGTIDKYADATSKVLKVANLLFNTISTVNYSLESEFISNNSGVNKYVVCNQFDRSVSLDKTNHYIMFSGFTSTIDSTETANQATNCVVEWSYNMCHKKKILDNGPATIEKTISYTANMK